MVAKTPAPGNLTLARLTPKSCELGVPSCHWFLSGVSSCAEGTRATAPKGWRARFDSFPILRDPTRQMNKYSRRMQLSIDDSVHLRELDTTEAKHGIPEG